jgi:hypothetical protein
MDLLLCENMCDLTRVQELVDGASAPPRSGGQLRAGQSGAGGLVAQGEGRFDGKDIRKKKSFTTSMSFRGKYPLVGILRISRGGETGSAAPRE